MTSYRTIIDWVRRNRAYLSPKSLRVAWFWDHYEVRWGTWSMGTLREIWRELK